jgi:hypothetical protein
MFKVRLCCCLGKEANMGYNMDTGEPVAVYIQSIVESVKEIPLEKYDEMMKEFVKSLADTFNISESLIIPISEDTYDKENREEKD